MKVELDVLIEFWAVFVLGCILLLYAFKLSKRMGGKGLLTKTTMYAGFSAFAFGFEHLIIALFGETTLGFTIAEGIEGVAALLLLMAVYDMYKLVRGD